MSFVFCSQPFALEVTGTRCPDLPNYTLTSDACKSALDISETCQRIRGCV